jgi:hypothetical protein
MDNLIIKNKKETVLTASNWKEGFIAVDERRHWEPGRSAERLANDFSNGNPSSGEKSLRNIIKLFLGSDDILWKEAYIEHGSKFDKYRRPRMQDLAIWGEFSGQSFFVGVEAKVDEPFGSRTIKEQEAYIKSLSRKTNAGRRLTKLKEDFLQGIEKAVYEEFRYQLLYYLAGSFREEPDIIIMPVIAYNSKLCNKQKAEDNYYAYTSFMTNLGFTKIAENDGEIKIAYSAEITDHKGGKTKRVYSCYIEKDS